MKELEHEIVGLDPFGQDKRMVIFAYQDLKTFLDVKWKTGDSYKLHRKMVRVSENSPEEVKAFLKSWTSRWASKWRGSRSSSRDQSFPNGSQEQRKELKSSMQE